MKDEVRKPAVAELFIPRMLRPFPTRFGIFWPGSETGDSRDIVGLVSPHAGYIYSGRVAAEAFKLIQGMEYEAVIVVAPSHRAAFQEARSTIEQDMKLLWEWSHRKRAVPKAAGKEPSPPLSPSGAYAGTFLGGAAPLSAGGPRVVSTRAHRLGRPELPHLRNAGADDCGCGRGKKVLLVASTDLSHFHSYEEAVRRDQLILEDLRAFDPKE